MKIKDVVIRESVDVIHEGDAFDIELGDLVIETGVVGFTEDGVIVEADEKTLALLGLSGALLESVEVNEVSLGDYYTKATKNKALSQMGAAFAPSPEERAKNYNIAGRRERGLARAKIRSDKALAVSKEKQKADYEQKIRDKYAGVDIDAEIAQLKPAIDRAYHDYQYGARNTYSQAGAEYQSLQAKVQELKRAKDILQQGVAEGLADAQQKIQDTINKLEDRLKHAKSDEQWDRIRDRIERLQAALKRSKQGVAEGQSQYTDMTVAQQVFKDNPDIDHENDVLNAAFPYVVKLVGSRKRANYMFNYDEDFPGDLISAYRWLQRDQYDVREDAVDEAKYQGREVPLGKPMQGDVKKSKVYVRGPKGNVVKVNFGDKKMKIKKSNPKRRKSFRARHNCANPGPRWKARYWSCRAW